MTITLSPDQERAVAEAIREGRVKSIGDLIERALAALRESGTQTPADPTLFEQGLGLFGGAEDTALLDEVVAAAYEERHRPSKREPTL